MKNFVQGKSGTTLQYLNATGSPIVSGQLVLLGDQNLAGVANEDIANAATGSVTVPAGIVVKTSVKGHNGTNNAAIDAYDKVYLTAGETFLDVDAAAVFVGYTLGGVASGATETEEVLLVTAIA